MAERIKGRATLPKNDANAVEEAGRDAWQRIKTAGRKTFEDWLLIGAAFAEGRRYALEVAKTTKPNGRNYSEAFSYWIQTRDFDDITKSDRADLLNVMGDLDRIQAWLAKKTDAERAKWNHPSTVWRVSRCKDRGIEAEEQRASAPPPDPKDLPPPVEEFTEEQEGIAWQRGLLDRVRKILITIKIDGPWLLPEPPDDGLLVVVDQLIEYATNLRSYLQEARNEKAREKADRSQDKADPELEDVG